MSCGIPIYWHFFIVAGLKPYIFFNFLSLSLHSLLFLLDIPVSTFSAAAVGAKSSTDTWTIVLD